VCIAQRLQSSGIRHRASLVTGAIGPLDGGAGA
jgi:hypothetical protein